MILVRTPFRLPLGGGGTDLPAYYEKYGGKLITAAVNKYMFISINTPAIVDNIKLNYSRTEVVAPDRIEDIRHDLVREALKWLDYRRPLEISSMADLSAGTGMGSSSSYTVGLWKGLNTLLRRDLSTQQLAEDACHIEIDLAGKPIGKQDQYAAAFGGILSMDIDPDGTVHPQPLDVEHEAVAELEHRLMMFYTGIQRDANTILAEQGQKVSVSEEQATRGMHTIRDIGTEVGDALRAGDVDAFGRLLHRHWTTKKTISTKMSDPAIDGWYDLAMRNGALGGKLMGAGGGGFLLFCVEEGRRRDLRSAMTGAGLRFMDFRFDWEGSKVLVNL
ncbi:MAG: galactokinase [Bacteroidetes bacterium]|nr:galactokinase [Bacteroidota bacterium]